MLFCAGFRLFPGAKKDSRADQTQLSFVRTGMINQTILLRFFHRPLR